MRTIDGRFDIIKLDSRDSIVKEEATIKLIVKKKTENFIQIKLFISKLKQPKIFHCNNHFFSSLFCFYFLLNKNIYMRKN